MFNPHEYLIKLPRKVKDKTTGQYTTVYDDYLQVKYRVVLFRERFPHGRITTEEILVDLDRGYARYKTTVDDGEGGTATGFGTETQADFGDFAERAETRAVGRALALLGFGTEFVGSDLTEGEHVCDAPSTNGSTEMPASAPTSNNGQAPPAPPTNGKDHPTEADISALTTLAVVTCHEDSEVFGQRLRTIMKLKPSASVAPRLLTRTMSMAQYREAIAYYERLQAQLERPNMTQEVLNGPTPEDPPVAEPATTQPPTQEAPPVPFVEPSPVPEAPPVAAGPGPDAPAEGFAPPDAIKALKRLAAQVSAEAAEDLEDVLSHSPAGLLVDVAQRIERRLQGRLHGKQAAA
jgi:hypothetical protein